MNLKKNLFWAGLARVIVRGLALVKVLFLARILTPLQFGVFGVASLALGLIEMLSETGVNIVLIQDKKNIKDYLNTAFAVSIARGIFISTLIFLSSDLISQFFNSPESTNTILLISLVPFIRGFINPAIISYQKDLRFDKEFSLRSFLTFVDVSASIVICLFYKTELGLVWGMIIASFFEVLLSFWLISDRPRLEFNWNKLGKMINKGKWVTMAKIFDYLFVHLDDVVVGKILGSASLGIYQQSYRISTLPITEAAEVFQRVTFPYFSRIADKKELRRMYFRSLLGTLFFVFPFSLFIILFPELITQVLLGPDWGQVASVLPVLAIFSIIKTIANSAFPLLLGVGRQDLVMMITLVGIIALSLTIFPMVGLYGLIGAGLSTVIASLLMVPVSFYWIKKYV